MWTIVIETGRTWSAGDALSSLVHRFSSTLSYSEEPLANARGSDRSRDREGAVSRNVGEIVKRRTKYDGGCSVFEDSVERHFDLGARNAQHPILEGRVL